MALTEDEPTVRVTCICGWQTDCDTGEDAFEVALAHQADREAHHEGDPADTVLEELQAGTTASERRAMRVLWQERFGY